MGMKICGAPCSWGAGDPKRKDLLPWKRVLKEVALAGYKGLELGPYGYLPINDTQAIKEELHKNQLIIIAGTIFDDLVTESNFNNLVSQTHNICKLLEELPKEQKEEGQHFSAPYLVLIDWGHDERRYTGGHPDKAPRLNNSQWKTMMDHIRTLAQIAAEEYNIRSVIHHHVEGYIEFEDEINRMLEYIPYETAGLCLDTGHLYYAKMDPVTMLKKYADYVDYIHFKDIDSRVYQEILNKHLHFFDACNKGVFSPMGQGIIDYPTIYKQLKEINYNGYITIEQERDPKNSGTSLLDERASLEYLKDIGF